MHFWESESEINDTEVKELHNQRAFLFFQIICHSLSGVAQVFLLGSLMFIIVLCYCNIQADADDIRLSSRKNLDPIINSKLRFEDYNYGHHNNIYPN